MTSTELIAALSAQGVELRVVGGRLRYRPRAAVTPAQCRLLAAHKRELLELLRPGGATWGEQEDSLHYCKPDKPDIPDIQPGDEVAAGDTADPQTERVAAHSRWRIVHESWQPVTAPILLPDGCTTVVDPALSVRRSLEDLELAIEHLNEGRESLFTRLIDERVGWLRACGVFVRVEK